MKTKIQIKSISGKLLFEFDCENNSIKKTVENANINVTDLKYADLKYANLENANLENANLRGADLRCANLRGANFRGSNLRGADLINSDIRYANFIGSNLIGANLSNSDIRYANFIGSNLIDADLSNAKNKEIAYLPIYCKWSHSIIGDKIQIGCKEKTIEEWENFFNSDDVLVTERNTYEFKQIQAVFEAYKGYLNFLNK
jgi:hypothetical protein